MSGIAASRSCQSKFPNVRARRDAASAAPTGNWFAALQVRAWAQYELGEYCEAIRTAAENVEQAYRHGDRSAMIVPLAVYAMVLKACGEVDALRTSADGCHGA